MVKIKAIIMIYNRISVPKEMPTAFNLHILVYTNIKLNYYDMNYTN